MLLTVALIAQMAVSQVEIIEEPNAAITIKSIVRDAVVHVDGDEVGPVNKKLEIFVSEDEPTSFAVTRQGRWDVIFDIKMKAGKSVVARIGTMKPGVTLIGNELTSMDIDVSNYSARIGENKILRTVTGLEIKGDPFANRCVTIQVEKVKTAKYYILRFEYIIDKGTSIRDAGMFGTRATTVIKDGKPHTVIIVVGDTHGWAIFDFRTIVKIPSVVSAGLHMCTFYYSEGARGRIAFDRFFFKHIDENLFSMLSKAYRQAR